jgi:hypothetical protein
MTKFMGTLQIVTSRKLAHVVAVEIITDDCVEVSFPHDRTLCGVLVRSGVQDIDVSLATCARCTSRADALISQS